MFLEEVICGEPPAVAPSIPDGPESHLSRAAPWLNARARQLPSRLHNTGSPKSVSLAAFAVTIVTECRSHTARVCSQLLPRSLRPSRNFRRMLKCFIPALRPQNLEPLDCRNPSYRLRTPSCARTLSAYSAPITSWTAKSAVVAWESFIGPKTGG